MHTSPTYIDISHIADHLGCRDDIIRFHHHLHHDLDNPCPEVDAYLRTTDDVAPLWLAARTGEWEEWNRRRKRLARRQPKNSEPEEHL